jgi:hypothetical protein
MPYGQPATIIHKAFFIEMFFVKPKLYQLR